MSEPLVDVALPEDWQRQVHRAVTVFAGYSVVAAGSSSSSSSRPRPTRSGSSSSSRVRDRPGQINNPEFEEKIKRGVGGRFEEKPRGDLNLVELKEKKVEDYAPPEDVVDEAELNKRRAEAFDEFSKDNKLDDKEKEIIQSWNDKMDYIQKVSPPPGDVSKGDLEKMRREAYDEFGKDKFLDKNELELVRKWDAKMKESEQPKPEQPEQPKPEQPEQPKPEQPKQEGNKLNPFLMALGPAVGPFAIAGVEAAKKAREALADSEIGGELNASVKAQFGDLSIEAQAGIAAGLKNPEERPGIIEGFIDGYLNVKVGNAGDEGNKPEPKPKPKPEPKPEPEPEPEPDENKESDEGSGKYTVQKGDNLWDIVKANLPEGASNADILEKTKELYENNKETVGGDWNLIHPGQELDISSLKPQPEQPKSKMPGEGWNGPPDVEGMVESWEDKQAKEQDEKDEGEKKEEGKKQSILPFLALVSPPLAIGLYAADKVNDSFKGSGIEASVQANAKAKFGNMSAETQASFAARLGKPETRAEAIKEIEGEEIASIKASISSRITAGINPESPAIEELLKELEKYK